MEKHSILLPDGRLLSSGGAGTAIGSVKLTQNVNSGTELTPGSVCAALLELELMDTGGVCPLQEGEEFTLFRDGKQVGIFTAYDPVRIGATRFSLTAYDRVAKLDKNLDKWLLRLKGWPYPAEEFVRMVCAQCGVEGNVEDLPNGVFPIKKFSATQVTGRLLVGWAAQIMGLFCRANAEGKIEFAWYTPAEMTIGPQNGVDCAGFFAGTLKYSDYGVAPVDQVVLSGSVVCPEENGQNVFTVSGNPYLTGTDADMPVAERLYAALSGFSYTPGSVTVPAGIFQPGQILQVTDASGKVFSMPVMTAVRKGERETLSCTGSPSRESVAAINNQSVESLSGKVQALQGEVSSLRSESREGGDSALSLAVQTLEAEMAFQKNSTQVLRQQLQQTEAGAETEKENDYALCLKQPGREMQTRIDGSGLQVERSGQTIVTADGRGVFSPKVQVQVLTVGSHTRLADYAGGTGCFYV